MKQNKCSAKNKKTCRYHGIKEFADEQKAGQEVLEALNKTSTFLINRKQRKELLRETYTVEDFAEPSQYTRLINPHLNLKAQRLSKGEADWQRKWLEENNSPEEMEAIKDAIEMMTKWQVTNTKIREGRELTNKEVVYLKTLDKIYATLPERGIPNRLFRGVGFKDETQFKTWLQSRMNSRGFIQLDEYTRTSADASRAFNFAKKHGGYPVMFEYISSKGIYTESLAAQTGHEREILFNRNEIFSMKDSYEVEIDDVNHYREVKTRIVRLRGD